MELIRLLNLPGGAPTEVVRGNPINGWKKALWVERYNSPGEFKVEGPMSSNLKNTMQLGVLVTHMDTETIMVVENQEIEQPDDEDPWIVITGRCITSLMELRTIGDYMAFFSHQIVEYNLTAAPTWDQVVSMIDTHIVNTLDPNDRYIGFAVNHTCTGASTSEERHIRQGHLLRGVQEVLKVDDLGIKSVRPTPTDPLTYYRVHRGVDRTTTVRFSHTRGDLKDIKYLYTNKNYYTQVRVMGRWVQKIVNLTGANNYDRRTYILDASDLDQQKNEMPVDGVLFLILSAMDYRGRQALKSMNRVSIAQADVSPNTNIRYGQDYKIGDLVTVDGDDALGLSEVFRVVEYAIAEDEDGVSGHPTLAIPGEEY